MAGELRSSRYPLQNAPIPADGGKKTPTEAQPQQRRTPDLRDADTDAKRYKITIESAADEFICPITTELPVDPVIAEDGHTYERTEISELIARQGEDLRSPVTNEPMGRRLVPAVQVRNAIEKLVKSGAISGEKAEGWKQRIEEEEEVRIARRDAERGDPNAMFLLGRWIGNGQKGFESDCAQAYGWFRRAADCGGVSGMAGAGYYLVSGYGVDSNVPEGMALLGMAAQGGSDLGAFFLGMFYCKGKYRFPRNSNRAKYWLRKAVGNSCSVPHMLEIHRTRAMNRLQELEEDESNNEM